MGSRAISIAKRFSGTLADAEWLRDCRIKAFEEGVEWERNLQRETEKRSAKWKAQRAKKKAKPASVKAIPTDEGWNIDGLTFHPYPKKQ